MAQESDPIVLFRDSFAQARSIERGQGSLWQLLKLVVLRLIKAQAPEVGDCTAMTLATVDARGRPKARVVLLKGVDERGFVFYTNRESDKGLELARCPFAALCIHWPALAVQVRIEGAVEQVTDEESDAYFATRPRISKLGAWASEQSRPLASREVLESRVSELEKRYPSEIPRPPNWGGYRVLPDRIEYWYARLGRLHDRFLYERSERGYRMTRLYP
jgi:pyridoxamine 5'-phosphate oxidase